MDRVQLVDSGNINVVVRVRPLVSETDGDGHTLETRVIEVKGNKKSLSIYAGEVDERGNASPPLRLEGQDATAPTTPRRSSTPSNKTPSRRTPWQTPAPQKVKPKYFSFDHVFDESTAQDEVFSVAKPLVQSVLNGYNATVLAYGATGSGKTHTIMGSDQNEGVAPRALDALFGQLDSSQEQSYSMSMTYVELHNNTFRNLLGTESSKEYTRDGRSSTPITVHENSKDGVFLVGPTDLYTPLTTKEEAIKLLRRGNARRATSKTALNPASSRSHAILTIYVENHNRDTQTTRRAKLNIVDLAGSERLSMSGAEGDALVEAQAINLSLMALSNVLFHLSQDKDELWLIPYRNSKLTHCLKDSLGGNSRTLMITHVRPTAKHYHQSLIALEYASRAKRVRTIQGMNISGTGLEGELEAKKLEIQMLKETLERKNEELKAMTQEKQRTEESSTRTEERLRCRIEALEKERKQLVFALRAQERLVDPALFQRSNEIAAKLATVQNEKEVAEKELVEARASVQDHIHEMNILRKDHQLSLEERDVKYQKAKETFSLRVLCAKEREGQLQFTILDDRERLRSIHLAQLALEAQASELEEENSQLRSSFASLVTVLNKKQEELFLQAKNAFNRLAKSESLARQDRERLVADAAEAEDKLTESLTDAEEKLQKKEDQLKEIEKKYSAVMRGQKILEDRLKNYNEMEAKVAELQKSITVLEKRAEHAREEPETTVDPAKLEKPPTSQKTKPPARTRKTEHRRSSIEIPELAVSGLLEDHSPLEGEETTLADLSEHVDSVVPAKNPKPAKKPGRARKRPSKAMRYEDSSPTASQANTEIPIANAEKENVPQPAEPQKALLPVDKSVANHESKLSMVKERPPLQSSSRKVQATQREISREKESLPEAHNKLSIVKAPDSERATHHAPTDVAEASHSPTVMSTPARGIIDSSLRKRKLFSQRKGENLALPMPVSGLQSKKHKAPAGASLFSSFVDKGGFRMPKLKAGATLAQLNRSQSKGKPQGRKLR